MEPSFIEQLKNRREHHLKALNAIDALLAIEAPNGASSVQRAHASTALDYSVPGSDSVSDRPELKRFAGGRAKVLTLIKEAGRFIHVQQMVDELTASGKPLHPYDRESVLRAVRNSLQGLKGEHVVKIQHDQQAINSFWGLRSWIVPGSNPKKPLPERMYDEARLK